MQYREKTKDIEYKKTMSNREAALLYLSKTRAIQKIFSFIIEGLAGAVFCILMFVPFAGWIWSAVAMWSTLVHNGRQLELSHPVLKPIVTAAVIVPFVLGTIGSFFTIVLLTSLKV